MNRLRVAVTGAAGQIGYAILTRIVQGDLCGDRPIELRLLEVEGALKALDGVVMELVDCAPKALVDVQIGSDPRRVFDGVNLALLIGAAPRRAGMERSELLSANGSIFAEQGAALAAVAADDLRVVVTGNPANTNAYIAARHARGVPPERFTALTRLDHNRARAMLARKVRQRPQDVRQLTIWGNHSATQYADAYHATILGSPATSWVDEGWLSLDFAPAVARRGAGVIAARGKSSAASAANATLEHARDWFRGTPPGDWTSMAVYSHGEYGVPEGLMCSFPVRCRGGDHTVVEGLRLNALARSRIDASVGELQAEAEAVRRLGLLPS
ncbi:malate dehydrogenase [Tessaracoccus sp. OH4464_COT-324]|uniref:malate dehydrogenase n=1 Tax=Tessaracoccus sp. OH4464_COT-324 TaxID=2491059 RepID=UPI000F64397E|nr:malate dehydrogenase [Tessaracoccus sp. OH4464_COT-324]RRD47792.1 malate dehydrogenase [Tessaracoccus sp. OH4464_COT-324]